jgi:hypothetical protein
MVSCWQDYHRAAMLTPWSAAAAAAAAAAAFHMQAQAMCSAITRGDIVTLRNLLRCNADPNSLDYDKRAPLHIAAADGNLQAVSWRVHRRICNAQAPRGGGGEV